MATDVNGRESAEQTPERPGAPTDPQTGSGGLPGTHGEAATDSAPVTELRNAAAKLRKLVAAIPSNPWGDRPWHVEECSDTDDGSPCPCIVAQGEYREFDQPQIPPVQYVADAETPEHAAYIATMHPAVGGMLAGWLHLMADVIAARIAEDGTDRWAVDANGDYALRIARLINGKEANR